MSVHIVLSTSKLPLAKRISNMFFFINVFFLIALFIVLSRGLFEIVVDKNIAYIIQALTWLLFVFALVFFSKKIKTKRITLNSILITCFLFISIISGIATFIVNRFEFSFKQRKGSCCNYLSRFPGPRLLCICNGF